MSLMRGTPRPEAAAGHRDRRARARRARSRASASPRPSLRAAPVRAKRDERDDHAERGPSSAEQEEREARKRAHHPEVHAGGSEERIDDREHAEHRCGEARDPRTFHVSLPLARMRDGATITRAAARCDRLARPEEARVELVRLERRGAVALVTLNRPDVLNALDRRTLDALRDAMRSWRATPAARRRADRRRSRLRRGRRHRRDARHDAARGRGLQPARPRGVRRARGAARCRRSRR